MRRFSRLISIGLLSAMLAGCGGAKIQSENLHLTQSLLTAVAAKNETWLAENERVILEKRAAGRLSKEEDRVFIAIVEQAKRGDWSGAAESLRVLQKSQRPAEK